MKVLAYLMVALIPIACANTKSKAKRHVAKSHTNTRPLPNARSSDVISGNETGTLVSANWIHRYKALEAKHGKVADDAMIYMEGDKYRIPIKVADHFNDMVRKQ